MQVNLKVKKLTYASNDLSEGMGIEFILGPMFSGKTTELIMRLSRARRLGKRCLAFKPDLDDRYGQSHLVTHGRDPRIFPCISIQRPGEIRHFMDSAIKVIGVDEVQLFDSSLEIVRTARQLLLEGVSVILAGLDMDYRRVSFEWTEMINQQDSVTRLRSVCANCGMSAEFTQRLELSPTSHKRIDVGGSEKYEPRCRKCHSF